MLIVLQWAGGIALGLAALAFAVLLSAAVLAPMEQNIRATTIVSWVIAAVIFILMLASAVGAWTLITKAIGL